ncbi:MAG: hypothetical protein WC761_01095 [Candidatus Paceibacterota bacterium]|jgi:hypothetical protein
MHWKHLGEFPKCQAATLKQPNQGWQGMELSGVPTVVYKSDNKIPMKLWGQPKPQSEQEAFKALFKPVNNKV